MSGLNGGLIKQSHNAPSDEPLDPVEAMDTKGDIGPQTVEEELEELLKPKHLAIEAPETAVLQRKEDATDQVIGIDDLIGEPSGTSQHITPPRRDSDDEGDNLLAELDSLDALMEDSEKQAAERKRIKEARKRAFTESGDLTPAAREALRQEIARWEIEHEYDAEAVLAVFETQSCGCGAWQVRFYGLYVREHKRADPDLKRHLRWAPEEIDQFIDKLPRERAYIGRKVPVCQSCFTAAGFEKEIQLDWEKLV